MTRSCHAQSYLMHRLVSNFGCYYLVYVLLSTCYNFDSCEHPTPPDVQLDPGLSAAQPTHMMGPVLSR